MGDSALGRLRILDFSRVLAGPLATMTLADLAGDLAEARRLALGADVVVENFRPGVMAKLGLDYQGLHHFGVHIADGLWTYCECRSGPRMSV